MNKEQQRKEFEEWALDKVTSLKIDEIDSEYFWVETHLAWESWQAAQKGLTEQRDRLAEAVNAATILIAAKGRHNTMLAYEGLREALQSLTTNEL